MDFLERLVDKVNTWLLEYKPTGSVIYSEVVVPVLIEGNSIALMPMPSSDYEHYMDGSYHQKFAVQIMARHENQMAAYMSALTLATYLGNLPRADKTTGEVLDSILSDTSSFELQDVTITTDTSIVGTDNHGYIYASQLAFNLYVSAD